MSREQTEGGTIGDDFQVEGCYYFTVSARACERGSSIAKDLINSEDPKHTVFCRDTAFVAINALFRGC